MRRPGIVAGLLLTLAGCTAAPAVQPFAIPAGPPAEFPTAFYRQAVAAGKAVYRVVPGRSRVVVRVYRAGPLAAFGHGHVVTSDNLHGDVLWGGTDAASRADLYMSLDSLEVDAPAARRSAGLGPALSPADVRATREHMLQPVLNAARYPFAVAYIRPIVASDKRGRFRITMVLHGIRHSYEIPLSISRSGSRLQASGRLHIRQTSFGIRPYAVLGGALRVADPLDVTFEVVAVRQPAIQH